MAAAPITSERAGWLLNASVKSADLAQMLGSASKLQVLDRQQVTEAIAEIVGLVLAVLPNDRGYIAYLSEKTRFGLLTAEEADKREAWR